MEPARLNDLDVFFGLFIGFVFPHRATVAVLTMLEKSLVKKKISNYNIEKIA
jgi:hypothetical protein